MLSQNTSIHNDVESRGRRPRGGCFVDHSVLQPDRWNAEPDGFVDMMPGFLTPPEDIYEVDRLRYVCQRRVGGFAQHLGFARVDRDDSIALRLYVARYLEAGAHRIRR